MTLRPRVPLKPPQEELWQRGGVFDLPGRGLDDDVKPAELSWFGSRRPPTVGYVDIEEYPSV